MIITVERGDSVFSIARQYSVLPEKILSDNGLKAEESLVTGQSLVILSPSEVFDAVRATDVRYISEETGVREKNVYRNNYFLGGRRNVPALSQVVLKYTDEPVYSAVVGGYAYDFISTDRLYEVVNYLTYVMPFTYGFTPNGSLVVPDDGYIIRAAKERKKGSAAPPFYFRSMKPRRFFTLLIVRAAARAAVSAPAFITLSR